MSKIVQILVVFAFGFSVALAQEENYDDEVFAVELSTKQERVSPREVVKIRIQASQPIKSVYKGFLEVLGGEYLLVRRNSSTTLTAEVMAGDEEKIRVRVVPEKLLSSSDIRNPDYSDWLEIKIAEKDSSFFNPNISNNDNKQASEGGLSGFLNKLGGQNGLGGALSSLLGGLGFGSGGNSTAKPNSPEGFKNFGSPAFSPAPVQNTIPPGSETSVENNPDGTKTVRIKTPDGKTIEKKVDEKGIVKSETVTPTPKPKIETASPQLNEITFINCSNIDKGSGLSGKVTNSGNVARIPEVVASEAKFFKTPVFNNNRCTPLSNINYISIKTFSNESYVIFTNKSVPDIQSKCALILSDHLTQINSLTGFGFEDCPTTYWGVKAYGDALQPIKKEFGQAYMLKPGVNLKQ